MSPGIDEDILDFLRQTYFRQKSTKTNSNLFLKIILNLTIN
jgi:hypothetical protein